MPHPTNEVQTKARLWFGTASFNESPKETMIVPENKKDKNKNEGNIKEVSFIPTQTLISDSLNGQGNRETTYVSLVDPAVISYGSFACLGCGTVASMATIARNHGTCTGGLHGKQYDTTVHAAAVQVAKYSASSSKHAEDIKLIFHKEDLSGLLSKKGQQSSPSDEDSSDDSDDSDDQKLAAKPSLSEEEEDEEEEDEEEEDEMEETVNDLEGEGVGAQSKKRASNRLENELKRLK